MTADSRASKRRLWRWLIVGALVAVVSGLMLWREHRRHVRARNVARELQFNGGQVYFRPSLIENLKLLWNDNSWQPDTTVLLGDDISGQWLEAHGFLADVDMDRLSIYADAQETDAIRAMIDVHTLKVFCVSWRADADPLAESLATESSLQMVTFSDSRLTDAGFRKLPLEQLMGIELDGTQVSAQALSELRRCRQLNSFTIDGAQLTQPVAEILSALPQLKRMELNGPGVSDEVVPLLRKLQQVRFLYLRETKISDEGLKTLNTSLPGCTISNESAM